MSRTEEERHRIMISVIIMISEIVMRSEIVMISEIDNQVRPVSDWVNESRQHTSSLKYNGYIFINHNTIMDREDDHFCLNGLSRRRAA